MLPNIVSRVCRISTTDVPYQCCVKCPELVRTAVEVDRSYQNVNVMRGNPEPRLVGQFLRSRYDKAFSGHYNGRVECRTSLCRKLLTLFKRNLETRPVDPDIAIRSTDSIY